MDKPIPLISNAWIESAKTEGKFVGTFAPFRLFHSAFEGEQNSAAAYWISWFLDEKDRLQEFAGGPEQLTDKSIVGDEFSEFTILKTLNDFEVHLYEDRLKSISLKELNRQQEHWKILLKETPRLMRGFALRFEPEYTPVELIANEIQKRIVDQIEPEEIEANHNNKAEEYTPRKRFHHGELKNKLQKYITRDECKKHQTVPSARVAKWVREIREEGYETSENIIRAKLSRMGFTSEKT
ncbi:MAG TPA: hypothetical protein VES59_02785 [Bacteroidota bacterium]|nr:hypothetical protein [Bacteroidota bacterium]